jgi:hypothetical protein
VIEILTLLHGLLMGPIEVHLRVPPETASIAVSLDGVPLIEHAGPPWRVEIPFPEVPRPAHLGLVALDAERRSLAELDRFVNLDLESCEPPDGRSIETVTPVLIELPEGAAEPTAQTLAGRFRIGDQPLEVVAVEAGPAELLVVQDPAIQAIFDQLSITYLGTESRQRLGRNDDRDQDILHEAIQSLEPLPEGGWEEGGDDGADDGSATTAEGMRNPRQRVQEQRLRSGSFRGWRGFADFELEGRIRYLWPAGPPVARLERETVVFPVIGPFDPGLDGVLWHLQTAAGVGHGQRLADAVAIAGFQAAATCRRRAVVLFEALETRDASLLEGPEVLSWLESVQVPLFALRSRELDPTSNIDKANADRIRKDDPWGGSTILLDRDVTVRLPQTADRFARFQQRVEASLERQRVVWLEGRHLPSEIDSSADDGGPILVGLRNAGRKAMENGTEVGR